MASSDKDLEAQLMEAGNQLLEPPSAVDDLLPLLDWLENRSKTFEPTYFYTMEKGYFLLPESVRAQHNIRTVNISISARHSWFGNRWQAGSSYSLTDLLGYLYNFQTKEFFNLSYAHEPPEGPARFGVSLVLFQML